METRARGFSVPSEVAADAIADATVAEEEADGPTSAEAGPRAGSSAGPAVPADPGRIAGIKAAIPAHLAGRS